MSNLNIFNLLNNQAVIGAINGYIVKADDELEQDYKEHNIANIKGAMDFTNELSEAIIEIEDNYVVEVVEAVLKPEKYELKSKFSVKDILEEQMYNHFLKTINRTSLESQYADIFHEMFEDYFSKTLIEASNRIDREIVITDYSKRTEEWLNTWAYELAEITDISNKEYLREILDSCKNDKKTIEETADLISKLGVRKPGHSARRFAITETYRINNYAEMESMLQNPSVMGKIWDHAGSSKNARKHHLALNGVTIEVDKPFELKGIKGGKYYIMAPHDTSLPAEEVVHCGCRIRPRTIRDILKKTPEEKAKLQRERLEAANNEWEKEFNERNRKATGVDFNIKSKKEKADEQQFLRYKKILGDNAPKTLEEFKNIKYNDSEGWKEIKLSYKDKNLQKKIREHYNLNIFDGKQGKHILGHNNYINGRSYLTIPKEKVQELIDAYAGTGKINRDRNGRWMSTETVTHNSKIGVAIDDVTGEKTPTNAFKIHYSKKGTHIVPKKEN